MNREKVIFCWSGGKDSALALYKIQQAGQYEVIVLVTTLNENFKRISMHGVREELLDQQAEMMGIPLHKVFVKGTSNEEYERKMEAMLLKYKALGAEKVIFGDIFLEDLRAWRDKNLAKVGMKGVYPLWKIDTRKLANEFISLGFKSAICCVNEAYLKEEAVGKDIDQEFIRTLPKNVDPCGENGEFHSFVYEGPIFKENLKIKRGEKVFRPMPAPSTAPAGSYNCVSVPSLGFWYCDLLTD